MFLSVDEAARLLDSLAAAEAAAPDQTAPAVDRVLIETLLLSGIKNSEFCRLSLADVTLSGLAPEKSPGLAKAPTVPQAAGPTGLLRVESSPTERREVVIPARLTTLLDRYLRDVRPRLKHTAFTPRDPAGPLVPNERGNPFDRTALYRRVVRVLSAHGLGDKAGVQLLRHTYGYLAYLGTGGNLLFVQRQLGHAHPMVTAVYAEFVDFDPKRLANAVVPVAPILPTVDERPSTESAPHLDQVPTSPPRPRRKGAPS
jgi:integrase